ncbi:hypothetical protein [Enterococcus sp. AZ103]|uniref:hypothetical protein n=1 Tax=Enterococcus sp. AZ103 TaxID=2774628 RepID=UPI003F273C3C
MLDKEIEKNAHDVALVFLQQANLDHKSATQVAESYFQAKKDIEKVLKEKEKLSKE